MIQANQLWWFLTSFLVIAVSFLYAAYYRRQIRSALSRVEETQIRATNQVADIIRETLSPRVYSRSGRRNVNREAADLVRKASTEENPLDRFLIIIGAPSMTTVATQDQSAETGPDSINEYEQALKDCPELNITRYISLPKPPEVKARRSEFQREYVTWLTKQFVTSRETRTMLSRIHSGLRSGDLVSLRY